MCVHLDLSDGILISSIQKDTGDLSILVRSGEEIMFKFPLKYIMLGIVVVFSGLWGIAPVFAALPTTVKHVDLPRYMGRWYEIASFPNWFQRHCNCTRATYKLIAGKVHVLNECYKGKSLEYSKATGTAWSVIDKSNAKLKVQFFWPFRGDYWILYLTPGYQEVIIGSPNRKYLWILARHRHIDKMLYKKLVGIAKQKGFDVAKLVMTKQNCRVNYQDSLRP